jgi:hypothetical protein
MVAAQQRRETLASHGMSCVLIYKQLGSDMASKSLCSLLSSKHEKSEYFKMQSI